MDLDKCLACAGSALMPLLDFGLQPAANDLQQSATDIAHVELLALNGCMHCGHMQQAVAYSPETLFRNYLYQSNTSNTLKRYFYELSQLLVQLKPDFKNLLEIASNDGTFLEIFKSYSKCSSVLGIDPAENLVKLAKENGVPCVADFFPSVKINGLYDIIVAQNVFAHSPDPSMMMKGVCERLSADGICLIQVSQADMVINGEFDTLYHEHFSFYSNKSMHSLAQRFDLKVVNVLRSTIHGGSKVFILRHKDFKWKNRRVISDHFQEVDLLDNDTDPHELFKVFKNKADKKINEIKSFFKAHTGHPIALVGVAAKSITVLQACGISVDFAIDEAPLKVGAFIPNTETQVQHFDDINSLPSDTIYYVGAWNFYNEIREKLVQRRPGIKTVAFFPKISIDT